MVYFFKTLDGRMVNAADLEKGCWIHIVNPNETELLTISEQASVELDFLKAALDEEETSRVEVEETCTLMILDVPLVVKDGKEMIYSTVPMGIIITPDHLITVSLRENPVIKEFSDGLVKNVQTTQKTRFLFQILLRASSRYLQYLRQIEKMSVYIEKQLHKSLRNKELIQLLALQKSLVYFSASLKADEITLEKILRGRVIKLYDDDQDLLEDVLIEFKQAIEMATIYSDVMAGTMDAFASVISNNLNIIMKVLTSITILLTIPNTVFSFFGMNVVDLPVPHTWFTIFITLFVAGITAVILWKKDLF